MASIKGDFTTISIDPDFFDDEVACSGPLGRFGNRRAPSEPAVTLRMRPKMTQDEFVIEEAGDKTILVWHLLAG